MKLWQRSLGRIAAFAVVAAQLAVLAVCLAASPAAASTGALITDSGCSAGNFGRSDDGSSAQQGIGFGINFFGATYSSLYVNNNGDVTFGAPYSGFSGLNLSAFGRPIIAPAFYDVDTRGPGSSPVTYGTAMFGGHAAYCVNWVNVGYYSYGTDRLNSSQLLLVDRSDTGTGNFDIVMNYDALRYETPGRGLTVGYSSGSAATTFVYPGSGTAGALVDSNGTTGLVHTSGGSAQLGRFVYQVRGGQPSAPGSQTINFPAPADVAYDAAPFSVNPIASSGLAVTLASAGACTSSGLTVTVTAIGTCTLTASQAGDSQYAPATSVTRTFAVTRIGVAITLTGLAQVYDGTPRGVTATAQPEPGDGAVSVTYGGSAMPPTAAGSYPVTATLDTPTHTGSTSATLVVAKATQVIDFPELAPATYGDADLPLTATSDSGLAVAYSATGPCTVTAATLSITGAGQCDVTASQAGDANHLAAAPQLRSFLVAKAASTVTITGLAQTWDGAAKPVTTSAEPAESGGIFTVTYDGSASPPSDAGSYDVAVGYDATDYTGTATAALQIAPAPQIITFPDLSDAVFADAPRTLTATSSSGLPVSYSAVGPCTVTANATLTMTGAGQCTVTATQAGDNNRLPATAVQRSLAIARATATVELDGLSRTYDGTPQSVTAVVTPTGLDGTLTLSYDGSLTAPTAAGTYQVSAGFNSVDYTGNATGTLIIAPAGQSITFPALTDSAFGTPVTPQASADSGLPVSYTAAGSCQLIDSVVTSTGTGSCTVTASQTGDANHTAAEPVSRSLLISPADVAVSLAGLEQTYDGSPRPVVASANPNSGKGSFAITYDGSPAAPAHAGSYLVVATYTAPDAAAPNYVGSATGTLTIARAPQTITFAQLSATPFGSAPVALTATADSGLPVTYTAVGQCTVDGAKLTVTGFGQCTVTAAQNGDADHLAAPAAEQSFAVTKANAAITLTGLAQAYDGTPRPVHAVVTPTDAGTLTITYDGRPNAPTHPGTYRVDAVLDGPDYHSSVRATLTVSKADQRISFRAPTAGAVGGKAALRAAAGSGLPVTFTASGGCALADPAVVSFVSAGSCTVTAVQAGNADFAAAQPVATRLDVARGVHTLTLDLPGSTPLVVDGSRLLLIGGSRSNLPVTLTGTRPCGRLAGVVPRSITPAHAGECTLTATMAGDADWLAASTTLRRSVARARARLAITAFDQVAGRTKAAVATTRPAGLAGVHITYGGKDTLPGMPGSYTATATLTNADYVASPVSAGFVIAAPAAAPVVNANTGSVPELAPGVAHTTLGGASVPVTATAIAGGGVTFTGPGYTARVVPVGNDAATIPTSHGLPMLARNKKVLVTATGYLPNTRVDVYLFSAPLLLGAARTNTHGSLRSIFPAPRALPVGRHTLQMNGYTSTGLRSTTVGVLVADATATAAAPHAAAAPVFRIPAHTAPANAGRQGAAPVVSAGRATQAESVHASRSDPYAALQAWHPFSHAAAVASTAVAAFALLAVTAGAGAGAGGAGGGGGAGSGGAGGRRKSGKVSGASAKYFKEKWDGTGVGDRSRLWRRRGTARLDRLSLRLPTAIAPASPLLARIVSDAAYLRAMVGSASLALPVLGVVLGAVAAVDVDAMALPPRPALMMALLILGVFDALAGFAAAVTFVGAAVILGGVVSLDAARLLLGVGAIMFAVPLIAGASRPFRRPAASCAMDWWTRAADILIASLVGGWAVQKTIGALPGLAGHDLPIAALADHFAVVIVGCLAGRIVLETVASWAFPARLLEVRPPKLPFAPTRQRLAALTVRTALFVFVAYAYVGPVWQLWVGAVLFIVPALASIVENRFPNHPRLFAYLPKRVVKTVIMIFVGQYAAMLLTRALHDPQRMVLDGFVLLALPGLAISIIEVFGRDGPVRPQSWQRELAGLTIVAVGVASALGLLA